LRGVAVEQELDLDDCRSSCRSCVTEDLQSSSSLLFKGSILDWGASSLRGTRSSRLGAYIPSCSSHGQEVDHIPRP
jgi:hypothetical protein